MDTVAQVCTAVEAVLSTAATQAAWRTEFVQRTSKLTGPVFVQTLVLGYWQDPQASWSHLAGIAGQLGVPITAQGLYQRCGVAGGGGFGGGTGGGPGPGGGGGAAPPAPPPPGPGGGGPGGQ